MNAKPLRLLPNLVTEEEHKDPPHVVANMELRTRQFIELRSAIQKLEEEHEAALAPFLEMRELLSAVIMKFLVDNGLEHLKTSSGTCYLSQRFTASVADAEAFMNLVKEGNWDLIERRANSTAVREWVKENNSLPAGVNLSVTQTLGVRRPTTKK